MLPQARIEAAAEASLHLSASSSTFQDVSLSDSLEAQFEVDFEQHLKRRNEFKKLTYGAVGAVGGGVIGFAASPVVLPGLAVAALVGGAGGYHLAKTKGKQSLQRHAQRRCSSMASIESEVPAGALPTLKRLKYVTKWGHWQLLDYSESPAEWRWSVLDEVVKAFFPWVQRMHMFLPSEAEEWCEVPSSLSLNPKLEEALQNLTPLYLFMQRRVVREAFLSAAQAVSSALDENSLDSVLLDRCRFLFPIVLDIDMQINRLDSETFESVLRHFSQRRTCIFIQGDPPRPRHQRQHEQLMNTLMELIERQDAQALIALSQQADSRSSSASSSAWVVYGGGSSPSHCGHLESLESFLEPLDEFPTFASCAEPPTLVEHRVPPPLVLPPEGAENEPGLGLDFASDDEAEFVSCSSGSVDERCEDAGDSEAHQLANRAASSSSKRHRTSHDTTGATPFEQRSESFPMGDGNHTWRGSNEHVFDIRSETYLQDKRKGPSGPAMFETVSMEIIRVGPAGPVWRVAKHSDFFPRYSRARGDNRFFIVHNWVFPPYQAILLGALDPKALWHRTPDLPQARLWRRFLAMDPEERKETFKVIISIDEGPWLVKRAAQKMPVIIGRKVKMHTFHEAEDHLEIVIDISTGKAEQMAVSMVMRALKSLKVSIATLLEGRSQDELPETLMFCGAVKYMDLSNCGYPRADSGAM